MKLVTREELVAHCGLAIIQKMQGRGLYLVGAAQRTDDGLFVYLLRMPTRGRNPVSYYWATGPTFTDLSPCPHLRLEWERARMVGEIRHELLPGHECGPVRVHHDYPELTLSRPVELAGARSEHAAWGQLRVSLGMQPCLQICQRCFTLSQPAPPNNRLAVAQ